MASYTPLCAYLHAKVNAVPVDPASGDGGKIHRVKHRTEDAGDVDDVFVGASSEDDEEDERAAVDTT